MSKTYLGDGLYARNESGHVVLSAENGMETTNAVYLDTAVIHRFIEWMRDNLEIEPLETVCAYCADEVD